MESGGGGGGWRDRLGWFLWPRSIDRAVADNASTHEHARAASSDTTNTRAEIHGPAGSLKRKRDNQEGSSGTEAPDEVLLPLQLRLRGGGKPKTRCSTARKREKEARWAAAATRLAERGRAIELDADGLPWIAQRPRLAPPPEPLPLQQKMVLRLRPGCEW